MKNLKADRWALSLRDLFITFVNDFEIYGADSLNKTRSMPSISLLDFKVWYPKYVLISSLDIFLKRNLWILFGPFQEKNVIKILNFEFILLLILAKWSLESLRRNVTSNMRVFVFTRYGSFYFRPHFWASFLCRVYEYNWNRHSFTP